MAITIAVKMLSMGSQQVKSSCVRSPVWGEDVDITDYPFISNVSTSRMASETRRSLAANLRRFKLKPLKGLYLKLQVAIWIAVDGLESARRRSDV